MFEHSIEIEEKPSAEKEFALKRAEVLNLKVFPAVAWMVELMGILFSPRMAVQFTLDTPV